MEAISAIGIFSSLVYALLLFNKSNKSYSDRILILWMFVFVVHLILPLMMAMGNRFFIRKVNGLDIGLYTLHITFLYYYSLSLTDSTLRFRMRHLLLLVPTASVYIIQGTLDTHAYFFSSFINRYLSGDTTLFHLTGVVFLNLVFCICFCIKFFAVFAGHRERIKNDFSYHVSVDLQWLRNLHIAALLMTVIAVLYLVGLLQGLLDEEWLNNFYFSSISIFGIFLGYWGYKQGIILSYLPVQSKINTTTGTSPEELPKLKTDSPVQGSRPDDSCSEPLRSVITLMENEKPYLDSTLNIGTLSDLLGMQAGQVSKLINKELHRNFYEFVNEYRIREFKKLIVDPGNKNYSIFAVALDAGFNSKATFNRIFKEKTGQTPSEFRMAAKRN